MAQIESAPADQLFDPVAENPFHRSADELVPVLQVDDRYEIVGVLDERAEVALAGAHLLLGLVLPDREAQDVGDRLEEIHLVMAELARLNVVDGEQCSAAKSVTTTGVLVRSA